MFLKLLKESVIFALNSIFVNKLRTFLSLLGITIGIFCIISVFTALDWMENSIHDSINSMGANIIHVEKWPWSFDPNQAWWDMMKWPAVSKDDFQALENRSTKAEYICFYVTEGKQVKYKTNIASGVRIKATTYDFINTRNFDIENGRYFTGEESASGKNVAVIGPVLSERLFDKTDPVGKFITIAGKKTAVIGVFKKEGNGGFNESLDEIVLIPLAFGKSFINLKYNFIETTILLKAKNGVQTADLDDETKMILRGYRRLHPGDGDNFSVNLTNMLTKK